VIEKYHLRNKVTFLITDNAANMVSAFRDLSGIVAVDDIETVDENQETDEEDEGEPVRNVEHSDDAAQSARAAGSLANEPEDSSDEADDIQDILQQMSRLQSEQVLDYTGGIVQKRMSCCIHTLQLVVIDGLNAARFMQNVQSKASRLSSILHTSGTFANKYFNVFKTSVPRTTNTRWNSMYLQLAAIAKLDAPKLQITMS